MIYKALKQLKNLQIKIIILLLFLLSHTALKFLSGFFSLSNFNNFWHFKYKHPFLGTCFVIVSFHPALHNLSHGSCPSDIVLSASGAQLYLLLFLGVCIWYSPRLNIPSSQKYFYTSYDSFSIVLHFKCLGLLFIFQSSFTKGAKSVKRAQHDMFENPALPC